MLNFRTDLNVEVVFEAELKGEKELKLGKNFKFKIQF